MTGAATDASSAVRARNRSFATAMVVLVLWYLAPVASFVAWWTRLPAHNTDGKCEGVGFGCSPSPRTGALLIAELVGLPAFVLSVAISLALLRYLLRVSRQRRGRAPFLTGLGAGSLAALGGMALVGGTATLIAAALR